MEDQQENLDTADSITTDSTASSAPKAPNAAKLAVKMERQRKEFRHNNKKIIQQLERIEQDSEKMYLVWRRIETPSLASLWEFQKKKWRPSKGKAGDDQVNTDTDNPTVHDTTAKASPDQTETSVDNLEFLHKKFEKLQKEVWNGELAVNNCLARIKYYTSRVNRELPDMRELHKLMVPMPRSIDFMYPFYEGLERLNNSVKRLSKNAGLVWNAMNLQSPMVEEVTDQSKQGDSECKSNDDRGRNEDLTATIKKEH